jgi:sterol desaturase/sphingolipid hydroxylase (fatty acid hydroxylase superfamily)
MKLDPIALAVPVFFLLIGLELLLARVRGRRVYRFTDSFADLGCGVTQRVVLLLFEAALLASYALLHEHGRLWTFAPGSPWPWVIAIVGVDLGYYWWHRLSHEVNFLVGGPRRPPPERGLQPRGGASARRCSHR